jgi:hypothetical protein
MKHMFVCPSIPTHTPGAKFLPQLPLLLRRLAFLVTYKKFLPIAIAIAALWRGNRVHLVRS